MIDDLEEGISFLEYCLIIIPIITIFLIRFFEALKHSDEKSPLFIFKNLFSRLIGVFLVSGILISILLFIPLILEIFGFYKLGTVITYFIYIATGTVVSYIFIEDKETSKIFIHTVNDDTWMTNSEERILYKKLKKIKNYTIHDKLKIETNILKKRSSKDKYYFRDGRECLMSENRMDRVEVKKQYTNDNYYNDVKYF